MIAAELISETEIFIENNKIELKKFPIPPKGKSITDVNVIISIDNDNQNH